MNKPTIKKQIRLTIENLLELHESENLSGIDHTLVRKSIINLELAKMELNK